MSVAKLKFIVKKLNCVSAALPSSCLYVQYGDRTAIVLVWWTVTRQHGSQFVLLFQRTPLHLSDNCSPRRKLIFWGPGVWIHLYLSRAEKQRMYSVIQRSSATVSCDRLIFSRSAERARRRSRLELRLSDSRRVWTQASDVLLWEEKPERSRERERSHFHKKHTGVLLLMSAECLVTWPHVSGVLRSRLSCLERLFWLLCFTSKLFSCSSF